MNIWSFGDDKQSSDSRQRYKIRVLYFTGHKVFKWMKSDRICWIDSRTIKRGCVLVLDGSLVPFCSKCLGACMRANDALKRFEKEQV